MCSDVHLPTMHDSEKRISAFIDSMNIAMPDFIIELGDFVIPDDRYHHMYAIWESYPGEKYHVIGNHEMDGGTTMEEALAYRGMQSSYYAFAKNGFNFIVLDGNDKKYPGERGYRQYMGPQQQNWLKEELRKTTGPVIIFSHQGLGTVNGVDNAIDMRGILQAHNVSATSNPVVACFYGHSHYDFVEKVEGIWYICINSMSYNWLGEQYAHVRYSDDVDKEFRWIKYTAPFEDPLYTVVELSAQGYIKIAGKYSRWVGPAPWEVGYSDIYKPYLAPEIKTRYLTFTPPPR
jgi:predicted phosphodiesterase